MLSYTQRPHLTAFGPEQTSQSACTKPRRQPRQSTGPQMQQAGSGVKSSAAARCESWLTPTGRRNKIRWHKSGNKRDKKSFSDTDRQANTKQRYLSIETSKKVRREKMSSRETNRRANATARYLVTKLKVQRRVKMRIDKYAIMEANARVRETAG